MNSQEVSASLLVEKACLLVKTGTYLGVKSVKSVKLGREIFFRSAFVAALDQERC